MTRIEMYVQMCQLKVVDRNKNEWMPVWQYDGSEIIAYAPRDEAIKLLIQYKPGVK